MKLSPFRIRDCKICKFKFVQETKSGRRDKRVCGDCMNQIQDKFRGVKVDFKKGQWVEFKHPNRGLIFGGRISTIIYTPPDYESNILIISSDGKEYEVKDTDPNLKLLLPQIGDELCDMHEGKKSIPDYLEVVSVTRINSAQGSELLPKILQERGIERAFVSNKWLYVIDDSNMYNGTVTAMFYYDFSFFEFIVLKLKEIK